MSAKWAFLGLFLFLFCLFDRWQLINTSSAKMFANDRVWTVELWYGKKPLCQQSHYHCQWQNLLSSTCPEIGHKRCNFCYFVLQRTFRVVSVKSNSNIFWDLAWIKTEVSVVSTQTQLVYEVGVMKFNVNACSMFLCIF